MPSHGLSEGRGVKELGPELLLDAEQFLETYQNQGTTYSLLSHSTGGAVCANLPVLSGYKGHYTMAPLLLPLPISPIVISVLSCFLCVCPCVCGGTLITPPRKTDTTPWLVFDSEDVYRAEAVEDPLCWKGKIPLSTGKFLMDFAASTSKLDVKGKMKIVHGSADGLVPLDGSKRFAEGKENVELWQVDSAHFVISGRSGMAIRDDIVEWMKARMAEQ